jgi:hypothetical protein
MTDREATESIQRVATSVSIVRAIATARISVTLKGRHSLVWSIGFDPSVSNWCGGAGLLGHFTTMSANNRDETADESTGRHNPY